MPPKRKASTKEAKSAKAAKTDDKEETISSSSTNGEQFDPCRAKPNLNIVSWNVNGIRAWLKKPDGLKFLEKEGPDVVVLQETKCTNKDIPKEMKDLPGYFTYFDDTGSAKGGKDGYAGVALCSKKQPIKVTFGIGVSEHDVEGRVVAAEYEKFYCVGAYVPNSGRGLVRLKYRQEWDVAFLKYLNSLNKTKPVICAGDFNVAHNEIDLKNPESNRNKTAGFTDEERADFDTFLAAGYVDSFRLLYPDKKDAYTFWSYMMNARGKNIGWRLDYFVVSDKLKHKICESTIHSNVMGSDHCPISLKMAL